MQKLIEYAEKYSQWVAVGIGALWFLWMVYGSLLSPPVTVAIGPKDVGPGDVDPEIVAGPITRLKNEMRRTDSPPMPIQPFAQKFADAMGLKGAKADDLVEPWTSAQIARVDIVIGDDEEAVKRFAVIPEVPSAEPLGTKMGRSTVQVPPADWKPNPNDAEVQPAFLPDDRDWVSVFFTVDLQGVAAEFDKAQIPANGSKTVFLEVSLLRQELQPNGTWGPEQVVRPLPIHQIPPFPQKGNRMQEARFLDWAIRNTKDIINPAFYQWIDGEQWLKWGDEKQADPAQSPPEAIIPPKAEPPAKQTRPPKETQKRPTRPRDEGPPGMIGNPRKSGGGGRPGYAPVDAERPASAFDRQYQRAPAPPPMINPEGGMMPGNFGGAGGMPMQPRGDQPGINPDKAPDATFDPKEHGVWIIHAHDDTAQPGKTYRYRIDYKLKNPLFATNNVAKEPNDALVFALQPKPKTKKQDIERQWTAPVTIPPRTVFFVNGTSPKGDFPTVRVDIFNWHRGDWHHKLVTYSPGDLIRWSERGNDGQMIDFSSGWTVVDLRIDPKNQDPYILLINDDGSMMKRDSRNDQNDERFKELKNETDKAKAANAAAQR